MPVSRKWVGSRPFAAASASTVVPDRAAIADSVSPGWTTYEALEAVVSLTGTTVPEELDDAEEPDRRSTVPINRNAFGLRPLAAASESTLRPARAAIAESVSPGWTT